MRIPTLALCAALLAAGAAFAQTADQGPRGFLTPEQRAMMMQDQRPQGGWRSMTEEQRDAARDQMRAKWQAMSPADKEKLRAEMQAKWEALPADQKQIVEQRIAARQSRHDQGGSGQ